MAHWKAWMIILKKSFAQEWEDKGESTLWFALAEHSEAGVQLLSSNISQEYLAVPVLNSHGFSMAINPHNLSFIFCSMFVHGSLYLKRGILLKPTVSHVRDFLSYFPLQLLMHSATMFSRIHNQFLDCLRNKAILLSDDTVHILSTVIYS